MTISNLTQAQTNSIHLTSRHVALPPVSERNYGGFGGV
jgi:hypothetical protein